MSDENRPVLLITVDAEPSRHYGDLLPYEIMMHGEIEGGRYGVDRIMDICESHGACATFFLDVLAEREHGEKVRHTAELMAARNHEVQIHTHPFWTSPRHMMTEYNLAEQIDLIEECRRKLEDWTGRVPLAHRAGDLAANADTLRALAAVGIPVDSSWLPGWAQCRLPGPMAPNRITRVEGVTEIPISSFHMLRLGRHHRYSPVDCDTCTLDELRKVTREFGRRGARYMTVFLHSFSFIRFNKDRTRFGHDPVVEQRFRRFLQMAIEEGFEVKGVGEFYRQQLENSEAVPREPGPGVPVTGFAMTYRRSLGIFRSSWKARFFVLLPLLGLLGLALLLRWILPLLA